MPYRVELVLRHEFAIEDLTERLLENPKYIFVYGGTRGRVKRLRRKERAIYRWRHKGFGGPVKLRKRKGVFWAEVPDSRGQLLLGSFVAWLFVNAADMVYRADVREAA